MWGVAAFSTAWPWRQQVMQIPSLSPGSMQGHLLFPSQWFIAHQSRGGMWPMSQNVF